MVPAMLAVTCRFPIILTELLFTELPLHHHNYKMDHRSCMDYKNGALMAFNSKCHGCHGHQT